MRGHRAKVLADLIREHGWSRGAELGVFRGDTISHLLAHCSDLEMIGVDVWAPIDGVMTYPGGRTYDKWPLDQFYQQLLKRLSDKGWDNRASLVRERTVDAAASFPDESFDFVFIDGDHTTEGVTGDIFAWAPKVKATGWLLGHDYNKKVFRSVVRPVDAVFPSRRLYTDHVWGCPKAESVFGVES